MLSNSYFRFIHIYTLDLYTSTCDCIPHTFGLYISTRDIYNTFVTYRTHALDVYKSPCDYITHTLDLYISTRGISNACFRSARPHESCKIFKGRSRRNAFSKLVHRQYKSFPPDRFCQVENKKTTGLSNKHRTAQSCAEDQIRTIKSPGTGF